MSCRAATRVAPPSGSIPTSAAQRAAAVQDDLAGVWSSLGVVLVSTGKRDLEVLQYLKSVAFHNWLFGVEVTGASRRRNNAPYVRDGASAVRGRATVSTAVFIAVLAISTCLCRTQSAQSIVF